MSVVAFKKSDSDDILIAELESLLASAKAGRIDHCVLISQTTDTDYPVLFHYYDHGPAELNLLLDCLKIDLVLGLE